MKILHLNTNDTSGGAARAAHRLHRALKESGIDSYMLVQKKQSDEKEIFGFENKIISKGNNFLRSQIDSLPKKFYSKREKVPWSVNWLYNPFLIKKIKQINPDIINLHWINNGFFSLNQLKQISKLNIPIVWTLHDSWAFTGGCHIPHSCEKYKKKCGSCPLLNSKKERDLSRKIWEKKKKIFDEIDITIVTPSNWLKNCAEESSLLKNKKVVRIPNSIDTNEFKLIDKKEARKKLKLSNKKKYVLFGAMSATTDKNKGFDLLLKSLNYLKETKDVELLVFGNKETLNINAKIPIRYFGVIKDSKKLNLLYAASNVTVVPSRSENLPNMILESFACGTTSVAFKVGGIPDIIEHKKNGFLVEPFDVESFGKGITWILNNNEANILGENAQGKSLKGYGLSYQSRNYKNLYSRLL